MTDSVAAFGIPRHYSADAFRALGNRRAFHYLPAVSPATLLMPMVRN